MQETPLTLFDVSTRLGVSPSAVKKRIANLAIPVDRGARGKLLFEPAAFELLQRADELLKAGHGFEECRRLLGLTLPAEASEPLEGDADAPVAPTGDPQVVAPGPESVTDGAEPREPTAEQVVAASDAPEESRSESSQIAHLQHPLPDATSLPLPRLPEGSRVRPLPTPVFIQIGRRKAIAEAVEAAAPTLSPDLIGRLDAALRLIEEKEKQNQSLQSKLLVAYDEMTKLSATAAAFQERSLNLQHEVNKLQGELRLLASPPKARPWWKIWG